MNIFEIRARNTSAFVSYFGTNRNLAKIVGLPSWQVANFSSGRSNMPDKVARLFERKLECLTLGAMDILLFDPTKTVAEDKILQGYRSKNLIVIDVNDDCDNKKN